MFNETQKLKIKRISTDQFLPCGTQTVHILHGPGRDLSFSRRSSVRSLLQRRELNPERKQGARKEGKKRKEKKSRKEGKVEECAAPLPLRCVAFKPFIRALQGRFSRLHRRNLEPPHVPLFLLSFHSSPPTSPPPPFRRRTSSPLPLRLQTRAVRFGNCVTGTCPTASTGREHRR